MQKTTSSDSILPVNETSEPGPSSLDTSLNADMLVLETMAKRTEGFHPFSKGDVLKEAGREGRAYLYVTAGSVLIQRDARTSRGMVARTISMIRAGQPFNFGYTLSRSIRDVDYRYVAGEEGANVIVIGDSLLRTNERVREILKKRILPSIAYQYGEIRDAYANELATNVETHEAAARNSIFVEQVEELEEAAKQLKNELADEKAANETLRDKLRVQTAKLEKQETELTQLLKLRSSHTQLVEFLLNIEQQQRDAFTRFSDAFYGWLKVQLPTYTKDDADSLIKTLIAKGQLPFPKSLNETLEEEVHSQVMASQEAAPLTSRSRMSDPDITAPRRMPELEKETKKRSDPPQVSITPAPSTVPQGPTRKPSLLGLAALPHKPKVANMPPIVRTLIPSPPSALPSTRQEPIARKGPPPLPKPAAPPRPVAPPRKATPLGIDHAVIPPLTQRGQGRDASIKMPIEDLPPRTYIGVEPPEQRLARAPTEPFVRSVTPPAQPAAKQRSSAGTYSLIAEDSADSEKTLLGIGSGVREDEDDATAETGRSTIDIIPEEFRAKDSAPNAFGVPSLVLDESPKPREVTKQYTFNKNRPAK